MNINVGDIVVYRNQEPDEFRVSTVLDTAAGWITISDHGSPPEDDADIHTSLVLRVMPWSEYLNQYVGERKSPAAIQPKEQAA